MALEQSVNLDSKTKGGIFGITKRSRALEKWFLTAHERAATTTATKDIGGIRQTTGEAHKESGKVRVKRDEDDVRKVICMLKTAMSNPFSVDATEDEPLSNLATGVVMPEELSHSFLKSIHFIRVCLCH